MADVIRLAKWAEAYELALLSARLKSADAYAWPAEDVPKVAAKMIAAVADRCYNKEGRAMQETCKVLGIKHTYKAINDFIEGK
jgi:hypothetical protein